MASPLFNSSKTPLHTDERDENDPPSKRKKHDLSASIQKAQEVTRLDLFLHPEVLSDLVCSNSPEAQKAGYDYCRNVLTDPKKKRVSLSSYHRLTQIDTAALAVVSAKSPAPVDLVGLSIDYLKRFPSGDNLNALVTMNLVGKEDLFNSLFDAIFSVGSMFENAQWEGLLGSCETPSQLEKLKVSVSGFCGDTDVIETLFFCLGNGKNVEVNLQIFRHLFEGADIEKKLLMVSSFAKGFFVQPKGMCEAEKNFLKEVFNSLKKALVQDPLYKPNYLADAFGVENPFLDRFNIAPCLILGSYIGDKESQVAFETRRIQTNHWTLLDFDDYLRSIQGEESLRVVGPESNVFAFEKMADYSVLDYERLKEEYLSGVVLDVQDVDYLQLFLRVSIEGKDKRVEAFQAVRERLKETPAGSLRDSLLILLARIALYDGQKRIPEENFPGQKAVFSRFEPRNSDLPFSFKDDGFLSELDQITRDDETTFLKGLMTVSTAEVESEFRKGLEIFTSLSKHWKVLDYFFYYHFRNIPGLQDVLTYESAEKTFQKLKKTCLAVPGIMPFLLRELLVVYSFSLTRKDEHFEAVESLILSKTLTKERSYILPLAIESVKAYLLRKLEATNHPKFVTHLDNLITTLEAYVGNGVYAAAVALERIRETAEEKEIRLGLAVYNPTFVKGYRLSDFILLPPPEVPPCPNPFTEGELLSFTRSLFSNLLPDADKVGLSLNEIKLKEEKLKRLEQAKFVLNLGVLTEEQKEKIKGLGKAQILDLLALEESLGDQIEKLVQFKLGTYFSDRSIPLMREEDKKELSNKVSYVLRYIESLTCDRDVTFFALVDEMNACSIRQREAIEDAYLNFIMKQKVITNFLQIVQIHIARPIIHGYIDEVLLASSREAQKGVPVHERLYYKNVFYGAFGHRVYKDPYRVVLFNPIRPQKALEGLLNDALTAGEMAERLVHLYDESQVVNGPICSMYKVIRDQAEIAGVSLEHDEETYRSFITKEQAITILLKSGLIIAEEVPMEL